MLPEAPLESECTHVRLTVGAFVDWLRSPTSATTSSNSRGGQEEGAPTLDDARRGGSPTAATTTAAVPARFPPLPEDHVLAKFPRERWWGYLDYKHLEELLDQRRVLQQEEGRWR